MATQPLLNNPQNSHQSILLHLRRHNELTVAELCKFLGITSMAVRRHLAGLQKDGLVSNRLVKQTRGRPTYRYRLTAKAETLFPSGLGNLAFDLLDAVYQKSGHKGVMDLLTLRNEAMIARYLPSLQDLSLKERIEQVTKIFSDNGFMTEWEKLPDGNFFIYQQHCAVHHLATQYRQLCVLEPKLMQELLGTKVTRQQYMLKNDPICGYLVEAQTK